MSVLQTSMVLTGASHLISITLGFFLISANVPKPGDECLAVGWGIVDAEATPAVVADTLQEVPVPILTNCTKRYSNASMYVCGGFAEGGKDTCQGTCFIVIGNSEIMYKII